MTRGTGSLAAAVVSGDRRALARAITLVESSRGDHRADAEALIAQLLPHTGKSLRIGISGPPGVGKSTFIEALGLDLVRHGKRPAVLAIDPSSRVSGGSILGDKTRMGELSKHEAAFIRPSPSGFSQDGLGFGGVARRSREAVLVCEAAGFDPVIVETVGVGQSETAVSEMTDLFLLLLLPAGGDDLQGIKRGIMELADLVIVNKSDGALEQAAGRTAADYAHALRLMQPRHQGWAVEVLRCSALNGTGIPEVRGRIEAFRQAMTASGTIAALRRDQASLWFQRELSLAAMERIRDDPQLSKSLSALEKRVVSGAVTPAAAARELMANLLASPSIRIN
jgi:LAO/AO transport system kinase